MALCFPRVELPEVTDSPSAIVVVLSLLPLDWWRNKDPECFIHISSILQLPQGEKTSLSSLQTPYSPPAHHQAGPSSLGPQHSSPTLGWSLQLVAAQHFSRVEPQETSERPSAITTAKVPASAASKQEVTSLSSPQGCSVQSKSATNTEVGEEPTVSEHWEGAQLQILGNKKE